MTSIQNLLSGAKQRAKKLDIPFELTEFDIRIPTYCPILGIQLEFNKIRPLANSPSIDRIVPSLGYVPSNIQIISVKANRAKNNLSFDELKLFAKWINENMDRL